MAPSLPPLVGHPWPFTSTPETEVEVRRGAVTIVVVVTAFDEASEAMLERVAFLCAHARRSATVPVEVVALHSPRHRFATDASVAVEWLGRNARRLADPTGDGDGAPVRPLHDPRAESQARLDPLGWPTTLVVDGAGRVVGAGLGLGSLPAVGSALRDAVASAASRRTARRTARRDDRPTTADLPSLRVGPQRRRPRRLDAPIRRPTGVAVDGHRVLVADAGNDRVLVGSLDLAEDAAGRCRFVVERAVPVLGPRRVALRDRTGVVSRPSAGLVEVFDAAPDGDDDGTVRSHQALSEGLLRPVGVAFDRDGSVVVSDAGAERLLRYRLDETTGPPERRTIAGSGATGLSDGGAASAELCQPTAVARVEAGLVFLDAGTGSLRLLDDRGRVATLTANPPSAPGLVDGPVHRASFQHPVDVSATPDGTLLVADLGNARIRRITDRSVHTLGAAGLGSCEAVAALDEDRLLVVDGAGHRLVLVDHARASVSEVEVASVAHRRL